MKTSKRFGARYGLKIRRKVDEIESMARKKYQCPICGKKSVKRVAAGIWACKKCGAKFTGYAYKPY